jgi:hypothetical protein
MFEEGASWCCAVAMEKGEAQQRAALCWKFNSLGKEQVRMAKPEDVSTTTLLEIRDLNCVLKTLLELRREI